MVKKLFVAAAAAGLLAASVTAFAQTRIISKTNNRIQVTPVRVAKVKGVVVNGKIQVKLVGKWIPYTGAGTDAPDQIAFDNFEGDAGGVPTDGLYGEDCGLAGSRWYFGEPWVNTLYYNDMTTTAGGKGKQAEGVNFSWFWYVTGAGSSEECQIAIFTAETFSDSTVPDLVNDNIGLYDGVIYDFGVLDSGAGLGYYYTNVDLTGTGLFHQMPTDGSGGYLGQLLTAGGTAYATAGQPMLWGTKAGNPSQQGPVQWDDGTLGDGTDRSGAFEAGENFDYTFGVCPDPLGASVGFYYAAGAGPVTVTPDSFLVTQGTYLGGGVPELQNDDNQVLNIQQKLAFSAATPNVGVEIGGSGAPATASAMTVDIRATTTGSPINKVLFEVDALNTSNQWVVIRPATPPSGTGEQLYTLNIPNPQNHILTGNKVRIRLRWFDRGTLSAAWRSTVDQVKWTITP